ncbi:Transposon TX1 uncharacterized 149 kDa protein [Linum perenne]
MNSGLRIKVIQEELVRVQALPANEDSKREERNLLSSLDELWRKEERFWKQRARINWLNFGDRNTKFFHAATVQRKLRNAIVKLKEENGDWIVDQQAIESHVCDFFRNLFTQRRDENIQNEEWDLPKVVTRNMNDELCKPISNDEVRKAVFQMGANKSPGPDRFPGTFFRKFWNIIGEQLCEEIRGFFDSGEMPEGWNDTNITLIPKVHCPESISQFRPISCCNFKYKIISKIMSTRLKIFIPTIVSEMQSAFAGERAIQDNVIIVHEVLHNFKNRAKKGGRWDMMIKMDMKKAYDLVDWRCLDNILQALGFNETWCSWIRACVRSVKFSILLNGCPTKSFTPSRGIRQGDPISPYLFILLTNALSHLIQKGMDGGKLKGLKLNARCPTLTHILFADDTILFGDASVSEAIEITKMMKEYGQITGQEINFQKSSVTFSRNTPLALQNLIKDRLGFDRNPEFGKYLGVPSEWGRSKKDMVATMLTRMENLCQSWKSQLLSHAGKETLLKSVYQAIPTYIMSCFLLPKRATNTMNSMLSAFLWGGTSTSKTIHWRDGEVLCHPKAMGGLGFKEFRSFNLALLAKQGWRLLQEPDKQWAKLLKGLYFPNTTFLDARKGDKTSWIWASICDARSTLQLGARKNLMNGLSIKAFTDPWIPSSNGFKILSSREGTDSNPTTWMTPNHEQWDPGKLRETFNEEEARTIEAIPIGPHDIQDH